MSKRDKTLVKVISANSISLRAFASRYYDVKDVKIAQMTHDDFATYASDNHIEVQRIPFSIIKREPLERGIIIVVKDKYNQMIPFLNPEYVKLNDYTSLLEVQLESKYKCDAEIERLSYHLLNLPFDEVTDPIVKENLITMGIHVYNSDINNFKQHRKIMTYEDYISLDKEIEQQEKAQELFIGQLIDAEYEDIDVLEPETWFKSCDCEKVVHIKKMTKKRGKS